MHPRLYVHKKSRNQSGYVLLIAVMLIGAFSVAIAVTHLLLGTLLVKNTLIHERLAEAKASGDACVEEGLLKIALEQNFSGTVNRAVGNGGCSYTVIILSGEGRTLEATGTSGNVQRKIKVEISAISPRIQIASWEDVDNF